MVYILLLATLRICVLSTSQLRSVELEVGHVLFHTTRKASQTQISALASCLAKLRHPSLATRDKKGIAKERGRTKVPAEKSTGGSPGETRGGNIHNPAMTQSLV